MQKNYGIINIGSLKTKCLIGYFDKKSSFVPLYWSNNLTCFGCAMYENKNQILPENLEATIREVLKQKRLIEEHKCRKVSLFATHAFRNAANKDYVKGEIERKTGLELEVIGSEEEGRLYFRAVLADFKPDQDYIVSDIGGGSVQILVGKKDDILEDYSFKTGAQFLHETFTKDPHNPQSANTREDLEKMREFLEEQYKDIKAGFGAPFIYGSSNIIDLFKAVGMPMERNLGSRTHPFKVKPSLLDDFIEQIIDLPFRERERRYPFQEGYMWGIDKSFLNVSFLCRKLKSPYIIPSNASVLEGFLYKVKEENDGKRD